MRIEQVAALSGADREALGDLWTRAWTLAMPSIDFAARRAWFDTHLDALMSAGACVLLARPDKATAPAGFLTLDRATGAIDQLAVDPARAGRGVGRALMDEAKRLSPEGLHLSVNDDNPRALRFYANAGFVTTGTGTNAGSGLPIRTMRWRGV